MNRKSNVSSVNSLSRLEQELQKLRASSAYQNASFFEQLSMNEEVNNLYTQPKSTKRHGDAD